MKIGIIAPEWLAQLNQKILHDLGINSVNIKESKDLEGVNGLILSAGLHKEINVIVTNLQQELLNLINQQIVIMGIGDGIKFLAKDGLLQAMGIKVASGYKLTPESIFVNIPSIENKRFASIYLNQSSIVEVDPNIGILSKDKSRGPLVVRQGNCIACTFMVELSSDFCLYRYFKKMIIDSEKSIVNKTP